MRRQLNTRQPRPGFTLVELTIVVAIIAVLAALLLGAIGKARDAGKRTQTITEMGILEAAAGKFKIDNGFYPPDYVKIPIGPPFGTYTPGADTEADKTVGLFKRMFRGWDPNLLPDGVTPNKQAITYLGGSDLRNGTSFLQSSQCLVFFLGGPNLSGFRVGPDPTAPPGTTAGGPYDAGTSNSKKMSQYEFPLARLQSASNPAYNGYYLDPYGTPYAYFSTVQGENYPDNPLTATHVFNLPGSSQKLAAMLSSTSKFYNQGKIQIISAGPNEDFGMNVSGPSGTGVYTRITHTPGSGEYGPAQPGEDDIANFNGTVPLGSQGK